MALQTQNVAMIGSYIPYERPPQVLTLWSAIPRGLQSFIVASVTLEAITAGNELQLNLTAILPPNFAYVMNDANLQLNQQTAVNWANTYNVNLQNFYRAPIGLSVALSCNWVQTMVGNAQNDGLKSSSNAQPWPSFPIIGVPNTTGIQIVVSSFNNQTDAKTAGTIDAYISFWQFDLEQIRKYPINSPQPVHAR